MKYDKLDVLELDNNKSYVIAEIIKENNETYLYLANEDGSKDYLIVKVNKEDEKDFIIVENEEEFKRIAGLIQEKNKKIIDFVLNGKKANN